MRLLWMQPTVCEHLHVHQHIPKQPGYRTYKATIIYNLQIQILYSFASP